MTLAALHQSRGEFGSAVEPLLSEVDGCPRTGAGRGDVHDHESYVRGHPENEFKPLAVRPDVGGEPFPMFFGVSEDAISRSLSGLPEFVSRPLAGLSYFSGRATSHQEQGEQGQSHVSSRADLTTAIDDVIPSLRKQPFAGEVPTSLFPAPAFLSALIHDRSIFFCPESVCPNASEKFGKGCE